MARRVGTKDWPLMGVGMGTSHGSRVTGLPCALLGAARESLCNLVIPYSWGADERLNVA